MSNYLASDVEVIDRIVGSVSQSARQGVDAVLDVAVGHEGADDAESNHRID